MSRAPRDADAERRSVRRTALAAARLLGAEPDAPKRPPPRRGGARLAELIEHVSRALGVERPSGERTLMGIDNGELCDLLEERAQLGLAAVDGTLLEHLVTATLVLVGGDPRAKRALSIVETQRDGQRLLCAYTDRAAVLASPHARVECLWAVSAPRVAEFALTMGYAGCVINAGSIQEIVLNAALLHRIRTSTGSADAAG